MCSRVLSSVLGEQEGGCSKGFREEVTSPVARGMGRSQPNKHMPERVEDPQKLKTKKFSTKERTSVREGR